MTDVGQVRLVLETGRCGLPLRRWWWVDLRMVGGPCLGIVSSLDECRTRKAALALAKERLRRVTR